MGLAASNRELTKSIGLMVGLSYGPVKRSRSRAGQVAQGSDSQVQSAPKYGVTRSAAAALVTQFETPWGLSVSAQATANSASRLLSYSWSADVAAPPDVAMTAPAGTAFDASNVASRST